MKKIAILLAVAMLLSRAGAAIGEATGGMTEITMPDRVADPIGVQRGTRIVVGATTELSGYFATELWGKNTADMDARTLLHGYSTVVMSREFGMALDGTVVKGVQVKYQADGGRVYTLSLADDLCFSDGTKITAKDYVFSLLMSGSPVIAELGGTPQDLGYITGYAAYQAGEAQELAGLRLLSDNSFSIHVAAEYQSYFYGLMLL